jgi:ABC-type amino acid transport substrate-binding protein
MKNKKALKFLVVCLCLVFVGAMTACGSSTSEEKTYTVSTEPTYPPFDTTNDDGDIVGFDMDLMKAIAKDQGFKVKFQSLEFDSLIPALQSDNTDIVIAGMKATDERKKEVDFSDPYYKTGVYILVRKDEKDITDWDSFTADKGYKVAVQTGTTCADSAKRLKKAGRVSEVVTLNQVTTALQQLKNGDVDAVLVDKPVGTEIETKNPDDYKMVGTMDPDSEGEFAIAVKKGNSDLLDQINAGLKNVKDDGTYDKLCKKWNIEN